MAHEEAGQGGAALPERGSGIEATRDGGDQASGRSGPSRGRVPRRLAGPNDGRIAFVHGLDPEARIPTAECHSALRRVFSEPQTAPRDERRRGRPAFVLFCAQFRAAASLRT